MKIKTQSERSWMSAVTFAEAGEWETARTMIPLVTKSKWAELFEGVFMAVAFAEEGLHDEAQRLAGVRPRRSEPRIDSFLDSIGLRNARLTYGVMQEEAVC